MRLTSKLVVLLFCLGAATAFADLRIMADSSLRPVLPALAKAWQEQQPDMRIELSLANAGTLRKQLQEGQACDVIILADPEDTRALLDSGAIKPIPQKEFAKNQLVVVGKPGLVDDEELDWFDLLSKEWDSVAIGDPALVASGRAAEAAAQKHSVYKPSKVSWKPTSNEAAALDMLKQNMVDAAFVWMTDVTPLPPNGYKTFRVDVADQPAMHYTAASTSNSSQPAAAKEFILFLNTDVARDLLKKKGYLLP